MPGKHELPLITIFFRAGREHKSVDLPEASTSNSPGRKVHIRTECIEQLQKIGLLYERGTLTTKHFKKSS